MPFLAKLIIVITSLFVGDIEEPLNTVQAVRQTSSVPTLVSDTTYINRATIYNPSISQCDDTPFNTADGSFIDTAKLRTGEVRWLAMSWDLVDDSYRRKVRNDIWAWRGKFKFGDTVLVESNEYPHINGRWIVHDVMNGRYRKSVDFLTHKQCAGPKLGVCRDLKIIKL